MQIFGWKVTIASLGLNALVAQLCSACPCDTNCTHVYDTEHGIFCMRECGFAILRDVYDKSFLDEINEAFEKWRSIPKNVRPFEVRDGYRLRGQHFETGLPDVHPFNKSGVFYNRRVSQLVEKHFEGENASLEIATFLSNPSPSTHQPWHQDNGAIPFTVKVYMPLVDVSHEMGPVEMRLLKHDVASTMNKIQAWVSSDDSALNLQADTLLDKYGGEAPYYFVEQQGLFQDCTVTGSFERGTVLAYVNGLFHRGTPNTSGRNRTILHFSYMTSEEVDESQYMKSFKKHYQVQMGAYRRLYHRYRDEDHEFLHKAKTAGAMCAAAGRQADVNLNPEDPCGSTA